MLSISLYITESKGISLTLYIDESKSFTYTRYTLKLDSKKNVIPQQFNFSMRGLHSAERDMERKVTTQEVIDLVRDCWGRIKLGIERKQILIDLSDSNKSGASVGLHSSEKTKSGYLTVVIFIKAYHKNADYYDVEVKTTWKSKTMDSWKDKDENGKTMYHPEHGLLDMWDTFAILHYGKKDVMLVESSGIPSQRKYHRPTQTISLKPIGKINLENIPKR